MRPIKQRREKRVLGWRRGQLSAHLLGPVRGALLVSCVLGGVALLAACGSSSGSAVDTTPDATVTVTNSVSSSSSASAASTCRTADLTIALGQSQGAAGHEYVPVRFTNNGTSTCTLAGFPGVSFVGGAAGTQIGSPAKRATGGTTSTVTLQPGAVASSTLGVSSITSNSSFTHAAFVVDPTAACAATSVTQLTVSPIVTGPGTS